MGERVTHSLVTALRGVREFADLDEETLIRVVGASSNLFWSEGTPIFEKGSAAEGLYIVLGGRVDIFDLATDGEEFNVASIGPGDYFGELSLLLHTTHSKSARAAEETELMVVPKEPFQALLSENPALAEHFRRKLEDRLPAGGRLSNPA